MILDDFDNIDKNLVNTENLFRIIKNYKEIENIFSNPIEEDEYLMTFKKAMDSNSGKISEFYLTFWNRIYDLYNEFKSNRIYDLYNEFKSNLSDKEIYYDGMLYRKLAEDTDINSKIKFSRLYFCGLNYLSLTEIKIINNLINSGKAEIYIDADKYILNNKFHEASKYLNQYAKWFNITNESLKFVTDDILNENKNINLFNIASDSGQVNILNNILRNEDMDNEDTVLILPEVNQLVPVLNSIPDNFGNFNVTINYPITFTSINNFITGYLDLLNSIIKRENEIYFPNDLLFNFLFHPYIKYIDTGSFFKFKYENNKYLICRNEIVKHLSNNISATINEFRTLEKISDNIIYILELVYSSLIKYNQNDIESETIVKVVKNIKYLKTIIKNSDISLEMTSFKILLNEILNNESVSLKGDPLKRLQIMGIYETRALDFKNVIFLNSNEGFLPPAVNSQSIIPANLKRFFRRTMPEDIINNYAYMFYRLLNKCENLYLIYSTDVSSDSKEESRYIKQIEYEFKNFKNINIYKTNFELPENQNVNKFENIIIEKSDNILKILNDYKEKYSESDKKKQKCFSASSLNTYRECSLRFFYDYVIRLKEPEELTLEIDAAAFGTHIHKIMQKIYNPLIGKEINNEYIIKELKSLDETIYEYLND